MPRILFLPVFLLFAVAIKAQTAWKNYDYTYQPNIRTVLFLPEQSIMNIYQSNRGLKNQNVASGIGGRMDSVRQKNQIAELPIVDLNGGVLSLSFDDMNTDFQYYRFRIEYCNADWSPSTLSDLEYIQGYNEDQIPNGRATFGMISDFINYKITLPNATTRWTKSGNYLIHIYLDNSDKTPVLTRRFCVYESQLSVQATFTPVGRTEKTNTHHELDFVATYKSLNIKNPQREIKATVIQNSNWLSAKYNLLPNFNLQGSMTFDYQDSIVFPAGKEYRAMDLRSVIFNRTNVKFIESFKDGYEATLFPDYALENQPYRFTFDINGGYVIGNLDLQNIEDMDVQCEYPNVLFTFRRNEPFENEDLYVVGKMTDWQAYETFKMQYNEQRKAYYLDVPIKQGYYDYIYALVNKKDATMLPLSTLDGDWYETENNYTILVYYRPLGGRFDRLVAVKTVNSLTDRKR
jgi:hypothetical protein